ncbi:hypothetical protein H6P81_002844 [Aristolochia fimbriata]|uniref:RNase H type-1 domain-containing protein n=1 Tax=Aristolochia fimbriata TaxID=158543 RepID=A0AAV7FE32_ARIFI|nr:hypothetical protein H6P81_002844 [Aristolochia fimbriata]
MSGACLRCSKAPSLSSGTFDENFASRADQLKYIMSRPILWSTGKMGTAPLPFEINLVCRNEQSKGKHRQLPGRPPGDLPGRGAPSLGDVPAGAARRSGAGPSPVRLAEEGPTPILSFVLTQACSNNEAEYQAILLGSAWLSKMQIPQLHIYGDSALVIKQLTGEFEVKKPELEPFWRQARELLAQIPEASLHFVPRSENGPADALAGIAASLAQFDQLPSEIPICERWVIPPPTEDGTEEEQTERIEESFPISASQNEVRDWCEPIANFLRHGTLPVDLRERVQIRRAAPKYVFIHDILYRRSYEGLLLRCLSKEEGLQVLKETHSGICGAHQAGPKLHLQTKRLGYYWPSMLRDAIEMARTCKQCQLHADYIHQAPEPLHPTVVIMAIRGLGMDIIGPISPKSDSDRQDILAATDYFSKWAKLLLTEK